MTGPHGRRYRFDDIVSLEAGVVSNRRSNGKLSNMRLFSYM